MPTNNYFRKRRNTSGKLNRPRTIDLVLMRPKTSASLIKTPRMHVTRLGYRYTIKEAIPSGTSLWPPKTGIISLRKWGNDCMGFEEEYIGELARTFGERLEEHLRAPFLIYDHALISDHCFNVNTFSIVYREMHNITRTTKEAIYIRVNDPSLIRNIGKFQLPTFEMRPCKTPLPFISGNTFAAAPMISTPPPNQKEARATQLTSN